MEQRTEFFVGLDVHKDSISVAACEEGYSIVSHERPAGSDAAVVTAWQGGGVWAT